MHLPQSVISDWENGDKRSIRSSIQVFKLAVFSENVLEKNIKIVVKTNDKGIEKWYIDVMVAKTTVSEMVRNVNRGGRYIRSPELQVSSNNIREVQRIIF